jgi:hypothetical protein
MEVMYFLVLIAYYITNTRDDFLSSAPPLSNYSEVGLSYGLSVGLEQAKATGSLPQASQSAKSKAAIKKEKNWKPSQRSQNSKRPRGGKWLQEAGGDSFLADTKRLRAKLVQSADAFMTKSYSIETNGSRVTTGWQGLRPASKSAKQIQNAYSNGSIRQTVATFFPVPADL